MNPSLCLYLRGRSFRTKRRFKTTATVIIINTSARWSVFTWNVLFYVNTQKSQKCQGMLWVYELCNTFFCIIVHIHYRTLLNRKEFAASLQPLRLGFKASGKVLTFFFRAAEREGANSAALKSTFTWSVFNRCAGRYLITSAQLSDLMASSTHQRLADCLHDFTSPVISDLCASHLMPLCKDDLLWKNIRIVWVTTLWRRGCCKCSGDD